jgi:hypothetical protein
LYNGDKIGALCTLQGRADIDAAIQTAERNLAPHHAAARPFSLPAFDVAGIDALLARDLPGIDAAAAAHVHPHCGRIGPDGEAWVAELISARPMPG